MTKKKKDLFMKTSIKKICLFLAIILSPAFCFGAETLNINLGQDYLITTDNTINANAVENPKILDIKPFFTIFNEKNMLLVHPKKVGKTKLTFFLNTGAVVFDINVKLKNALPTFCYLKKNGIEFTLLDQPPLFKNFEIDAPPTDTEVNQ
jgi:hypothetical protein